MKVYIIALGLLHFVPDSIVMLEITNEAKHSQQKTVTKMTSGNYISTQDTWENNPDLKSLWIYKPPPVLPNQPDEETSQQYAVFKAPHIVTRLAKPLAYGFDTFFQKIDFEPFERRRKPVTLVAFKKYGVEPRRAIDLPGESAEVAEIQSSYNEITKF